MRPPAAHSLLLALAALALAPAGAGCATRQASVVHPHRGPEARFQEIPIELQAYKSPQRRRAQDARISVAAAVSGGGLRAANFAAGVLIGLEEISPGGSARLYPNALAEIDYISSVSGGGLAAGAYLAGLHDHLRTGGLRGTFRLHRALAPTSDDVADGEAPPRTDPALLGHLRRDYVSTILLGLIDLDTLFGNDRGADLEDDLDANLLGRSFRDGASLRLADVFVHRGDAGAEPLLPYWVIGATAFENGAIIPFTPEHLRAYGVTGYIHRHEERRIESTADARAYDRFLGHIPLSVALASSAHFPPTMPAITLESELDPDNPYLHLLDGSVGDDLGIVTAVRILDGERHPGVARRVLLLIDPFDGEIAPFSSRRGTVVLTDASTRSESALRRASAQGRSREIATLMGRGAGAEVVFLGLDATADLPSFEPLLQLGLLPDDLAELDLVDGEGAARQTPWDAVRAIRASYEIEPAEQRLLIAAGRWVARHRSAQVRAALGWK